MIRDQPPTSDGSRDGTAPGLLYHICRMRMDVWHRLRDQGRRVATAEREGGDLDPWRSSVAEGLELLRPWESYFAFPGPRVLGQVDGFFRRGAYRAFAEQTARIVRLLTTDGYRRLDLQANSLSEYADLVNVSRVVDAVHQEARTSGRPYFEVLVVDDLDDEAERELRLRLRELRSEDDEFVYELVVVRSFEDALIAVLLNGDIQSAVIRYIFPFRSPERSRMMDGIARLLGEDMEALSERLSSERSHSLPRLLKRLRPELDLFLVTDSPLERVGDAEAEDITRFFHRQDYYQDLHMSILKGVGDRARTPFFTALQRYARKPTGVFHALPISQGKSLVKSRWIRDAGRFFGPKGFLGETSATTGGLDSLLQPHGPIRDSKALAARAFGARQTYFVTNGTSTANKIVMQGLVTPGDIVLLAHDCHKSHPYAVLMSGALPVYLDAYPLSEYSMYGGVSLGEIKRKLLRLRRAGKLDRVKMLLLTNITFDGITYDPVRVMEEVLAIKPDMVFLWDEAWYAYGRFHPHLRLRTAMDAARRLRHRFRSPDYRTRQREWRDDFEARADDEGAWIEERLLPDPDRARVRVYSTQSTHKTLTALRQGSMIHISDDDFHERAAMPFEEAFMTHTSTSPNYPILASLDLGRRQVELEGFALVQESMEIAMTLRERLHSEPLLRKYFRVLGPREMIPEAYRPSGLQYYYDPEKGWSEMTETWRGDEFALDPTRITLHVGRTGMDGDTFKTLLMDRFDIQINKTSRNTVLFMIHIGTSRATAAHLMKALTTLARELDDRLTHQSQAARLLHERRVASLTEELPPLPYFSRFHPAFVPDPEVGTGEGDMRKAFFLAYESRACTHVKLDERIVEEVTGGRELVSASFVTPYPPGFPVLVPGQVISREILAYLLALDVSEIHGYRPEFGLRVFREDALREAGEAAAVPTERMRGARAAEGAEAPGKGPGRAGRSPRPDGRKREVPKALRSAPEERNPTEPRQPEGR